MPEVGKAKAENDTAFWLEDQILRGLSSTCLLIFGIRLRYNGSYKGIALY